MSNNGELLSDIYILDVATNTWYGTLAISCDVSLQNISYELFFDCYYPHYD